MNSVHKSGFVNIIGKPNVGKSTLMNAILGEKLSATTHKAQTTRHRILGIHNGDNYQIVFSDTPGVIDPAYKLQETMMNFVEGALEDADLFLIVVEPTEGSMITERTIEKIKKAEVPVLILVNKADTSNPDEITQAIERCNEIFPDVEVLAISALKLFNTEGLVNKILEYLPEHEAYYPKDELSDKNMRFFAAETIREKILLYYQKEIPYAVEVVIEKYEEQTNLTRIGAVIYVERDSQKGIIIGPKGLALKRVASTARLDIEKLTGTKVFLEIFVKVNKDWRTNDKALKDFGYMS